MFLPDKSIHKTAKIDPIDPAKCVEMPRKRMTAMGTFYDESEEICSNLYDGNLRTALDAKLNANTDLSYGLWSSLCTLRLFRSVSSSSINATLGTSGWLDLSRRGLPPRKRHQALLGAHDVKSVANK